MPRYEMNSEQCRHERRYYWIYDTEHPDYRLKRGIHDAPTSTIVWSGFNGTRARAKLAKLNAVNSSR